MEVLRSETWLRIRVRVRARVWEVRAEGSRRGEKKVVHGLVSLSFARETLGFSGLRIESPIN